MKPTQKRVIETEWIRVKEACEYAQISKPVLYGWMDKGYVRNFSGREKGKIKGTRLVSFTSLKAFLEAGSSGGEGRL